MNNCCYAIWGRHSTYDQPGYSGNCDMHIKSMVTWQEHHIVVFTILFSTMAQWIELRIMIPCKHSETYFEPLWQVNIHQPKVYDGDHARLTNLVMSFVVLFCQVVDEVADSVEGNYNIVNCTNCTTHIWWVMNKVAKIVPSIPVVPNSRVCWL